MSQPAPVDVWSAVTRSDLTRWAGGASVEKGRTYQRRGYVSDLRVAAHGRLLGTVAGTYRYITVVSVRQEKGERQLSGHCTCPVGGSCKHAVAVVAQYLEDLSKGRAVAQASVADPRWAALESGDEDSHDEEDWRDAPSASKPIPDATGDARVERYVRGLSPGELADLAWRLLRRVPAEFEAIRERLALQTGDAARLLDEVRRAIGGGRNRYGDYDRDPDFAAIERRLTRLVAMGRADDVVALGRDLIAMSQDAIETMDREGEMAEEARPCVAVVFEALARSSLSHAQRIRYAIDAELADEYGVIEGASEAVFDSPETTPADWSAVADGLSAHLAALPAPDERNRYGRGRLGQWLGDALEAAGRDDEVEELLASEARLTDSYVRMVDYLLRQDRADDARRWAREGVAATSTRSPGIAKQLSDKLAELARGDGKLDEVAAHTTAEFLSQPSTHTFGRLMGDAVKAGVGPAVRAAALRFLETGVPPVSVEVPPPPPPPAAKSKGKKVAAPPPPAPAAPRVTVARGWPLPVPDHVAEQMRGQSSPGRHRPRPEILVELAIQENRPDDALTWYERVAATPPQERASHGWSYMGADNLGQRVAAAVAATHPERALALYRASLARQLPEANQNAYPHVARLLGALRPLYDAVGRLHEWTALLGSIREEYRRRPRLMEQLAGLR